MLSILLNDMLFDPFALIRQLAHDAATNAASNCDRSYISDDSLDYLDSAADMLLECSNAITSDTEPELAMIILNDEPLPICTERASNLALDFHSPILALADMLHPDPDDSPATTAPFLPAHSRLAPAIHAETLPLPISRQQLHLADLRANLSQIDLALRTSLNLDQMLAPAPYYHTPILYRSSFADHYDPLKNR